MNLSFIYVKEKALNQKYCFEMIKAFEADREKKAPGRVGGRNGIDEIQEIKKSTDISFTPDDENHPVWGSLLREIIIQVSYGLEDYNRHFWMGMEAIEPVGIHAVFNMQRFLPNEGYYQIHCERGGMHFPRRTHAWMIYLNDIERGGQTEFPYQGKLEVPETGKLLIWPSDFTHIHRGVVAPNETKYILTGWLGWTKEDERVHRSNDQKPPKDDSDVETQSQTIDYGNKFTGSFGISSEYK